MKRLVTRRLETKLGSLEYYAYMNPTQSIVNLYIHGLGDSRNWFPKHFTTYSLDRFSWIEFHPVFTEEIHAIGTSVSE